MNDALRYVFAGTLIFLILLLQPIYLEWLGYAPKNDPIVDIIDDQQEKFPDNSIKEKKILNNFEKHKLTSVKKESFLTIVSPLYMATISNVGGGSFVEYIIGGESADNSKYIGGYDSEGYFLNSAPVSLIMPSKEVCTPCLGVYNDRSDEYDFINDPFILSNFEKSDTIYLNLNETIRLEYKLIDPSNMLLMTKSLLFYGNQFFSEHSFEINNFDALGNIELLWYGGLRPTEEKYDEDVQYGSGIISQAGEVENIQSTDSEKIFNRRIYKGQTDWVAIRTKYFMTALIAGSSGNYAVLSSNNVSFGNRNHTPLYSVGIGNPLDITNISASIYLGPLDIDYMAAQGTNLKDDEKKQFVNATMNWGIAVIRPISKGILWILKFLHKTLSINYGLVLLLFALFIRFITGPLTKKSFESTQNMQKLQPELKKIQAKYKNDPQGLNRETMALYKNHKVNPLGGCLPILIQMPLLWALFIVFRTTIEFRGAPFFLWISDLSKPDVVFNLPFTIPIYGSGVAILPLIMGATLMLTMRMSSSTMDSTQKPVMYFMNLFFILLFNTFPSGLNLYYTAYNILSFLQQKGIRNRVSAQT